MCTINTRNFFWSLKSWDQLLNNIYLDKTLSILSKCTKKQLAEKIISSEELTIQVLVEFSLPTTAKCQGWSTQGIRHFNELYGQVEKEWLSHKGLNFENDFLEFIWMVKKLLNKNIWSKRAWYMSHVGTICSNKMKLVIVWVLTVTKKITWIRQWFCEKWRWYLFR